MAHIVTMVGLLMVCSVTHAAEVTATSPAIADIQAAVDSLDGPGTVRVPAGEAEAVGTLKVAAGVSIIGAGGARILTTLLYEMQRRDLSVGMGVCTIVERV